MASLTIRNLDEDLKARLRMRAARHGCSMEAEVRNILRQTLLPSGGIENLAVRIHERFKDLALENLPVPPRQAVRTPPDFGESE
jgi:plasmid stability protein